MIEKRVEEAGWSGRCEKLDKVIAWKARRFWKNLNTAARQKTSASNAGVRTMESAPTIRKGFRTPGEASKGSQPESRMIIAMNKSRSTCPKYPKKNTALVENGSMRSTR
jgi:hypothetical protein